MATARRTSGDALAAAQARIAKAAEAGDLDQSQAPLLEALQAYHQSDAVSCSRPARTKGRALDEKRRESPGEGACRADAPAHKGLDDRVSSYKVQSLAQQLAADAFGA